MNGIMQVDSLKLGKSVVHENVQHVKGNDP